MYRVIIAILFLLISQTAFAQTSCEGESQVEQQGAQGLIESALEQSYADGVYEGEYSFVKVEVTIEEGKISDVAILEHGGGGQEYADMIAPLVDKVIESQSTDFDAITGATVSSTNFKNAVDAALEKAVTE